MRGDLVDVRKESSLALQVMKTCCWDWWTSHEKKGPTARPGQLAYSASLTMQMKKGWALLAVQFEPKSIAC